MIQNLGLKVIFDNSHGEIVGVLSFSKEDYSTFASILQLFGCELDIIADRITPHALQGAKVLLVPVPTKPFQQDELYAIHNFVNAGGGLLLIGEYGGYANNDTYLNQIAQMFGIMFNRDLICDTQSRLTGVEQDVKSAMVSPIIDGIAKHEVMQGIDKLRLELSCSVTAGGHATPLAWSGSYSFADKDFDYTPDANEQRGNIIFLASANFGAGRVIAMGDSSLISNENMLDPNHAKLGINMIKWLGSATAAAPTATPQYTPPSAPVVPSPPPVNVPDVKPVHQAPPAAPPPPTPPPAAPPLSAAAAASTPSPPPPPGSGPPPPPPNKGTDAEVKKKKLPPPPPPPPPPRK